MADITLSEAQLSKIVRDAVAQAQEQALPYARPVEQEAQTQAPLDLSSGFATSFHDLSVDMEVLGGFELFSLDISSRKNKKKEQAPQTTTSECGLVAPTPFPWKTLGAVIAVVVAIFIISTMNTPVVAHNASTRKVVKQVSIVGSTSDNVVSGPTITASYIEHKLCSYNANLCGTGQTLYDLGVQYNVDPAFALAFFWHESNFGTRGMAVPDHSLGNLRCIDNEMACNGGYAQFATWQDGYRAWFQLIAGSLYVGDGLTTVSQIIPRYAPNSDNNDEAAYIASVQGSVATYRAEGGQ